jgi:LysM repeat protein
MERMLQKISIKQRNLLPALGLCGVLGVLGAASVAHAQNFPITPNQRATATQVAQAGVPLSELAPNAPDRYTVKRGDTLWAISSLFLKSPWNWPQLWGMNLNEIRNPHLIYPGQQLFLDKSSGRALLRVGNAGGAPTDTIKVSPRTRFSSLDDNALPAIDPRFIEPYLVRPIIEDDERLLNAPRIVSGIEDKTIFATGDRVYVRSSNGGLSTAKGQPLDWRIFRNPTPLRDPDSGAILGYEAEFVAVGSLIRGESTSTNGTGTTAVIVPGTLDIVGAVEESRVGDRLVPQEERVSTSFVPRAPRSGITGRIVSLYGNAVRMAGQNQVVAINRGKNDGLEVGHVFAIITDGINVVDRTGAQPQTIKLPDERNGLMLVFRTFDKMSYALVLNITDGVKVGDRFQSPR